MTHFLAVLSDTKKRRETVQCFEKLKILHQGRMSESAKENDNEDEPSSATINPALRMQVSHFMIIPRYGSSQWLSDCWEGISGKEPNQVEV